jgi:hypothetical protein
VYRATRYRDRKLIARALDVKPVVQELVLVWVIFIKVEKCILSIYIRECKQVEVERMVTDGKTVHCECAQTLGLLTRLKVECHFACLDGGHNMRVTARTTDAREVARYRQNTLSLQCFREKAFVLFRHEIDLGRLAVFHRNVDRRIALNFGDMFEIDVYFVHVKSVKLKV